MGSSAEKCSYKEANHSLKNECGGRGEGGGQRFGDGQPLSGQEGKEATWVRSVEEQGTSFVSKAKKQQLRCERPKAERHTEG